MKTALIVASLLLGIAASGSAQVVTNNPAINNQRTPNGQYNPYTAPRVGTFSNSLPGFPSRPGTNATPVRPYSNSVPAYSNSVGRPPGNPGMTNMPPGSVNNVPANPNQNFPGNTPQNRNQPFQPVQPNQPGQPNQPNQVKPVQPAQPAQPNQVQPNQVQPNQIQPNQPAQRTAPVTPKAPAPPAPR